jgi:hypothetical protein
MTEPYEPVSTQPLPPPPPLAPGAYTYERGIRHQHAREELDWEAELHDAVTAAHQRGVPDERIDDVLTRLTEREFDIREAIGMLTGMVGGGTQ